MARFVFSLIGFLIFEQPMNKVRRVNSLTDLKNKVRGETLLRMKVNLKVKEML